MPFKLFSICGLDMIKLKCQITDQCPIFHHLL